LVRTAILGLGNVAERIHIPALRSHSEVELVAGSEPRWERGEEMRQRFDLPAVYKDSLELLRAESPDLVLVGTPPDSHRELCLAALESGADVLCEKPFMPTVEAADEVIAAARRHGRHLAVNTQYRYMEIYRQVERRLRQGELGRLYSVQFWQQMYHPSTFEPLEWRARLKQSTLYEFGTHALDLVSFFFDDLPLSIYAQMPQPSPEFDSDVVVQASLRFPDERLATLHFNRVSHAPERYLEVRLDSTEASVRISLGGVARAGVELVRHRGSRHLQPRLGFVKGGEARIERGGRSRTLTVAREMAFASATAAYLGDFLARRREAVPDFSAIEHAREILRTALAGYESAASGKVVELR